ncbi:hypothetical protein [Novosphingobium umbonatum]|nr:hypothetical protein [Novosphingobium umbonatum]
MSMRRLPAYALALAAPLALAACGSSDKASETVTAENVEMPAEQAMSGVDAAAMPVIDSKADSSEAPTTTEGVAAAAGQAAADVAAAAAAAGVDPNAAPSPAAKKAQ